MFDRDLPLEFTTALARLESKLAELGFELTSESYRPDAFDSASTEYRQGRKGRRLRLVWDGKDGTLWLDASRAGTTKPSAADWAGLEAASTRPESIRTVRYGESDLEERIDQLLLAIDEEFDRPHT
jgi:hypothetical protein